MRVWVDSKKPPPVGSVSWDVWCKSCHEAMDFISDYGQIVSEISLSYHLEDRTAIPIADMIEKLTYQGDLSPITWYIHDAPAHGKEQLVRRLVAADAYWSHRGHVN